MNKDDLINEPMHKCAGCSCTFGHDEMENYEGSWFCEDCHMWAKDNKWVCGRDQDNDDGI